MKSRFAFVSTMLIALCACRAEVVSDAPAEPEAMEVMAELKAAGGGRVTCPKGQVAFPEVCNAFDDDCDGRSDEGACTDNCDAAW